MAEQPSEDVDSLAIALKSLSHPKRLRLLRFLVEPHSLEEIASSLGVARQSAQEHLDQLLTLGMVEARRARGDHGPVTHYVVVVARVFDIHEQLGQRIGILEREMDENIQMSLRTAPADTGTSTKPATIGARLTIVHGMRIGRTTLLEGEGPWMLGRDPHATICLDYDPYVSTRHAEVRRIPGGFQLADLYSSNGTYKDWEKLARGAAISLESGSLMRIGKTILHFRAV